MFSVTMVLQHRYVAYPRPIPLGPYTDCGTNLNCLFLSSYNSSLLVQATPTFLYILETHRPTRHANLPCASGKGHVQGQYLTLCKGILFVNSS